MQILQRKMLANQFVYALEKAPR